VQLRLSKSQIASCKAVVQRKSAEEERRERAKDEQRAGTYGHDDTSVLLFQTSELWLDDSPSVDVESNR